MKFSTINAGQAGVAGGFCFVVRKVRVKAAQKLNRGRNRKLWFFFVVLGSAFARLNLLVYEPQKKKHSKKTVSYAG